MADRTSRSSCHPTLDTQIPEETLDQMYEEALSEASTSRLNVLFEESFDKAFETHFNGVYCTRRSLTQNFNLVSISPRGNHECEAKIPLPHLRVGGQDKKNPQKRRQSPLKRSK